ncbi:MAG: hypothetical protein PVH45_01980, partial [Candidatus Omnitrophota bacterium]
RKEDAGTGFSFSLNGDFALYYSFMSIHTRAYRPWRVISSHFDKSFPDLVSTATGQNYAGDRGCNTRIGRKEGTN